MIFFCQSTKLLYFLDLLKFSLPRYNPYLQNFILLTLTYPILSDFETNFLRHPYPPHYNYWKCCQFRITQYFVSTTINILTVIGTAADALSAMARCQTLSYLYLSLIYQSFGHLEGALMYVIKYFYLFF